MVVTDYNKKLTEIKERLDRLEDNPQDVAYSQLDKLNDSLESVKDRKTERDSNISMYRNLRGLEIFITDYTDDWVAQEKDRCEKIKQRLKNLLEELEEESE